MQFEEVAQLPADVGTNDSMCSSEGVLSITGNTLRWLSHCGRHVHREFSFDEPPLAALFCPFPLAGSAFLRCIVVVVSSNKLRIFSSGDHYDVHLNFSISRVFASSIGLLVERQFPVGTTFNRQDDMPVYVMTHPIMRVGKLMYPPSVWVDVCPGMGMGQLDESSASCSHYAARAVSAPKIMAVHGSLLCTFSEDSKKISVFQIVSDGKKVTEVHNISCSSTAADIPREPADRSRGPEDASELGADVTAMGEMNCGLEIRGLGFNIPPAPRAPSLIGTAPDASFASGIPSDAPLVPSFASVAGSTVPTVMNAGSHFKYAFGASNRRRKSDHPSAHDGSSSNSEHLKISQGSKVDSFYNALLGIDRSWNLQGHPEVTASLIRQSSSDRRVLDITSDDVVSTTINPTLTPSSRHSYDVSMTDNSGVTLISRTANSHRYSSESSEAFSVEKFFLVHAYSIPLYLDGEFALLSKSHERSFCEDDSFFGRIFRGQGGVAPDTSSLQEEDSMSVSFVPAMCPSTVFVDVIFSNRGEFRRYSLSAYDRQSSPERDVVVLADAIMSCTDVSSSAHLSLPTGNPATVLFFNQGPPRLICGNYIVGPIRFKCKNCRSLSAIRSYGLPSQLREGSVDGYEQGSFLLGEERSLNLSNGHYETRQYLFEFSNSISIVSPSMPMHSSGAPWYATAHSIKLGYGDTYSERLLLGVVELLAPKLYLAALNVLLTGHQLFQLQIRHLNVRSVNTHDDPHRLLWTPPANYLLLAAFYPRIRSSFRLNTSNLYNWIHNTAHLIASTAGVDGTPSGMATSTPSDAGAFEESITNFAVLLQAEYSHEDQPDVLFDLMHVITEDLILGDRWACGTSTDETRVGGSFSDYLVARQTLFFIAVAAGGESCRKYLDLFSSNISSIYRGDVSDSVAMDVDFVCNSLENDVTSSYILYLTGDRMDDQRSSAFLAASRFTFSKSLLSASSSVSLCAIHWLQCNLSALDIHAQGIRDMHAPMTDIVKFDIPCRYQWYYDSTGSECRKEVGGLSISGSLVPWCRTLNMCFRFLHFLQKSISLTSGERNKMGVIQAWRLMYAFISCSSLSAEHEESVGIFTTLTLLPPALALAIELAVAECATQLPEDLFINDRSSDDLSGVSIPKVFVECLASMDTVMLVDRTDIAFNALSSLSLTMDSPEKSYIWDKVVLNSTSSAWRAACLSLKRHQSASCSSDIVRPFKSTAESDHISAGTVSRTIDDDIDGLNGILGTTFSRFPHDERMREVCKMLDSKREATLRVVRTQDMDDLAYKAKQQQRLLFHSRRTFAASIGRGMVTLSSMSALMAEPLRIPPLSIGGRVPPLGTLMLVDGLTPDVLCWPEFHNGVAAGLRVKNAVDISSSADKLMKYFQEINCRGDKKLSNLRNSASNLTEHGKVFPIRDPNKGAMRYWILYNRASSTSDSENAHAGALLAFGLLGHLRVLTVVDVCEFLTTGHQPTTIAMLIGLAASHLGTSDLFVSKTLCLHIPSLIPAGQGVQDLDIPVLTQAAALTALGLLNAGTGNRSMAEFLLAELNRRPKSDKDTNSREVYALSAAWALGMLAIGRSNSNKKNTKFSDKVDAGQTSHAGNSNSDSNLLDTLSDLRLDMRLLRCVEGGLLGDLDRGDYSIRSRAGRVPNSYAMDLNAHSSTIIEPEDTVNIAVTSYGSIIALSLMYIRSESETISSRLQIPQTCYALESERPDILFVRALSTCLIHWDQIEFICGKDEGAALRWLNSRVPQVLQDFCYEAPVPAEGADAQANSNNVNIMSHRCAAMAYMSIMTGYCMGLALIHAGTGSLGIKNALCTVLKMMIRLRGGRLNRMQKQRAVLKRNGDEVESLPNYSTIFIKACTEKSSKILVEMLFSCVALAAGIVMSGTGDIDVLRLVREGRTKSEDSPYGTLIAMSMTTGFLFLCGGKAALKRDPVSVGVLLLSVCPWFPGRSSDNKSHLQATRHLYALAVEWRWLRCLDVDCGTDVDLEVEVHLKASHIAEDCASMNMLKMSAPCLLPELSSILKVAVSSPGYFPAELRFNESSRTSCPSERGGGGQSLVIYLKKKRTFKNNYASVDPRLVPGLGGNQINFPSLLQHLHKRLTVSLQEILSLKHRPSVLSSGSRAAAEIWVSRKHQDLFKVINESYLDFEEKVLSTSLRGISERDFKPHEASVWTLLLMSSLDYIFKYVGDIPIPDSDTGQVIFTVRSKSPPDPQEMTSKSLGARKKSLSVLFLNSIQKLLGQNSKAGGAL